MKHRQQFQRLRGSIPEKTLDPQTVSILDDFKDYFEKYPNHQVIDFTVFIPSFKRRHPGLDEEKFNQYVGILRNVISDADAETTHGILQELHTLSLGTTIGNLVLEYEEGRCPDLAGRISHALDRYKIDSGIRGNAALEDDIWDLLQQEFNDSGVRWRLSCLNQSMRGLRGGDFGIIAGRPDKGKTTFLTSEVSYMAPQLPAGRNVIWLNNEGKGQRIIPRLYQSALGVTISDMRAMGRDKLIESYRKATDNRNIFIHDIHGMSTGQVELILEAGSPGLVIFDMIDHIRGFGGESRNDLVLEEMYKWARERAVKYDCICLATSQISNEGDGLQFPTLGMLKDSKTGKQGACDFQLMIGATNDPNTAHSRYIGLPKNKLRREGAPGDPRAEVWFKPDVARYEDWTKVEGAAA